MKSYTFGPHDKDKDELIRLSIDWVARLASGDSISVSSWSAIPSGLTIVDEGINGTAGTCTIEGGTLRKQYDLTNQITTALGERLQRTIRIAIVDR